MTTQRNVVKKLASLAKRKAAFIEPMDCAPVTKLADGPGWIYEIKLDGYRAEAVRTSDGVRLFSRKHKFFDHHYPLIVEALAELPEGTVVDGEIVSLDSGSPGFNPLRRKGESNLLARFAEEMAVTQYLPIVLGQMLLGSSFNVCEGLKDPIIKSETCSETLW